MHRSCLMNLVSGSKIAYNTVECSCLISFSWASLRGTGPKRIIKNKNICLRRESNQRSIAFQPRALDRLACGTDVLLR